ncbi:MAG: ABC transporter permease [Cellvibrionaceae bacterium]
MKLLDLLQFSFNTLMRHRLRTFLVAFAVAIGVAAVCLLTALGEGARRYVVAEFSNLGSNLLIVMPGRTETTGGMPAIYGATPRDLTVNDALMLARISGVKRTAPVFAGTALVESNLLEASDGFNKSPQSSPQNNTQRSREVIVLGSTPDIFPVRHLALAQGKPLPDSSFKKASPVCVLGSKLKWELFGHRNAVGQWVRIDSRRFRVTGVLAERGQSLGMDLRDMVIVPVQSAAQLFNTQSLFRVLMELEPYASEDEVKRGISRVIKERHQGDDDVTVISQDSVLAGFENVLELLTVNLGVIAGISLLVAGVLIMNISLITVSQHRQEIGLLKALGANNHLVKKLFVTQALLVASIGAVAGVVLALSLLYIARIAFPVFPLYTPLWAPPAAIFVAIVCGVIFSWWPSKRAAALQPVLALRE